VGDPIEASALHTVFGEGRTPKQPLFIGSVKSNIGHLEGASGVVSIIKSAMMLEKGFVLPNCNFEKGNPKIPFEEWNLKVFLPSKALMIGIDLLAGASNPTTLATGQEIYQRQQFWIWRHKCPCCAGKSSSNAQASDEWDC
jgi:hypothetical protein